MCYPKQVLDSYCGRIHGYQNSFLILLKEYSVHFSGYAIPSLKERQIYLITVFSQQFDFIKQNLLDNIMRIQTQLQIDAMQDYTF